MRWYLKTQTSNLAIEKACTTFSLPFSIILFYLFVQFQLFLLPFLSFLNLRCISYFSFLFICLLFFLHCVPIWLDDLQRLNNIDSHPWTFIAYNNTLSFCLQGKELYQLCFRFNPLYVYKFVFYVMILRELIEKNMFKPWISDINQEPKLEICIQNYFDTYHFSKTWSTRIFDNCWLTCPNHLKKSFGNLLYRKIVRLKECLITLNISLSVLPKSRPTGFKIIPEDEIYTFIDECQKYDFAVPRH